MKVFLSYSHTDSLVAHKLQDLLNKNHINVIWDNTNLSPGMELEGFIKSSAVATEFTISIVSK